jgi:hypothetical protein
MTLRIVLLQPPAGIDFGLQKGKGSNYEIVQKQRSTGSDLQFELELGVKPGPDFNGPFVQGPKGERFIYIGIGTYAGQSDSQWSRRLKVPLTGITETSGTLQTRIVGTARDGGPTCATPRPFAGWTTV